MQASDLKHVLDAAEERPLDIERRVLIETPGGEVLLDIVSVVFDQDARLMVIKTVYA